MTSLSDVRHRSNNVLQLDIIGLYHSRFGHVSIVRRTVRYFRETILFSWWDNHLFHRYYHSCKWSNNIDDNLWNGLQRCWRWQSTACVSFVSFLHAVIDILLSLSLAAIAEIVTNKQRGLVQAILDVCIGPWSVFGGLIGNVSECSLQTVLLIEMFAARLTLHRP